MFEAFCHDPSIAYLLREFARTHADAYRQIVEVVGYSRRELLDRMIAAQALVRRATLVTLKASDFRHVPGLELLSW